MKRLLSLTAAGLLCGSAVLSTPGIAGAASMPKGSVIEPGGPMVRVAGHAGLPVVSINWSGYAATSAKRFDFVHSTWKVPAVTCKGVANQWDSNWVGLDGFTNQTVEQDGTFAGCGVKSGHTKPYYYAWIEMFPAPAKRQFWVHAGDSMDATVRVVKDRFTLTISDQTSGKSATTVATCASCQRASAEWIIERPAYCNHKVSLCHIAALADFGTTTMSDTRASLEGGAAKPIGALNSSPIFMFQPLHRGLISLDQVSALSGANFSAQWFRSGTPVPITLGPRQ